MAETTGIAWTDSTFNPWIGCTKVGPGCDNCYAEALMDKRWHRVQWGAGRERQRTSASNWAAPLHWEKHHEAFALAHGRRRRVFCASLADVFDNEAPEAWRADLFALIEQTPHLDWLLLTKRIGNVRAMAPAGGLPANVWLGATMVNQAEYDRDVRKLLAVEASVRFLSVEPMVGPIRGGLDLHGLDWVIVGGESGHGARPIQREWIDGLRRECEAARVAFFFKQWGGASATAGGCSLDGAEVKQWPCAAAAEHAKAFDAALVAAHHPLRDHVGAVVANPNRESQAAAPKHFRVCRLGLGFDFNGRPYWNAAGVAARPDGTDLSRTVYVVLPFRDPT